VESPLAIRACCRLEGIPGECCGQADHVENYYITILYTILLLYYYYYYYYTILLYYYYYHITI
jgi:hypothetical protein